jgi:hypothetical protein
MRYSNTNRTDKYRKDQKTCSLIMGTYLTGGNSGTAFPLSRLFTSSQNDGRHKIL